MTVPQAGRDPVAPRDADGPGLRGRIDSAIATLNPGYFALVMSTGIVSVAMQVKGLTIVAHTLLGITAFAWVTLVVLTLLRIWRHQPRIRLDFTDPRRGFGFFTFTAATGVLGTRFAEHSTGLSVALLIIGWASWVILGYIVPWTAVLHPSRRPTLPNANGTWFIWVVASQSVAVLAATVEPMVDTGKQALALLAVFSWAVGCFLYPAVAILVTVRLMSYDLGPEDAVPAYWISMGATAITVLAGAKIVLLEEDSAPIVTATRGLIAGASVTFWVFGTWLIPILIAAGVWRHVVHKLPLRYDATLWSIIFPLGMYSMASHFLGLESVDDLPILRTIGSVEAWFALAMWSLVFVWMCVHLVRTIILGQSVPSQPERALHPGSPHPSAGPGAAAGSAADSAAGSAAPAAGP